ncbi:ATP-binding cassette domain-containing protein [Corynebacterium flavescens]|uniref:ATP-binding cassette domain-containing protein n=1 Tax=Corynebacterium flavescens TaxID=28028 RepID=UPI00264943B6|nr:ATP-binding cassette domain-containing protein [Corynebacterium flavescens]MDN6227200.1 ATP-binding cassette domain-containing protein [Corynebacterium flavescens]
MPQIGNAPTTLGTQPIINLHNLGLHWPDGTVCFDSLSGVFSQKLTGLIGDNGSGKTSLLRVLAGKIPPTSGSFSAPETVAYLPQDLGLDTVRTIADVFGVARLIDALSQVEAGAYSEELYEVIGQEWDLPDRLVAELAQFGFHPAQELGETSPLDLLRRPLGTLSGGESVIVALCALFSARPDFVLLDEPTNNLDGEAKKQLIKQLESSPVPIIVVSHDRELLECVEEIAELHAGTLRFFTGPFSAYEQAISQEQEAAQRQVRDAAKHRKQQLRERAAMQTRLARDERRGAKFARNKRKPGMAMGMDKNRSEQSAAKRSLAHNAAVEEAKARLDSAQRLIRDDSTVFISLPDTALPNATTTLELRLNPGLETPLEPGAQLPETLILAGPERLRVAGGNGVGKSTLLEAIAAYPQRASRHDDAPVACPVPYQLAYHVDYVLGDRGYIPQRILLDGTRTVWETIRASNPVADPQFLRDQLAQLLFHNDRVHTSVADLSGGERFRLAFAIQLLQPVTPRLLIFDEPTNNLDLATIEWLVSVLNEFRGGLIITSHDERFCEEVGTTRTITLPRFGRGEHFEKR